MNQHDIKDHVPNPDLLNVVQDAIRDGVSLSALTKVYFTYMLDKYGNNKVHASRALGVDRRTMQRYEKAKKAAARRGE